MTEGKRVLVVGGAGYIGSHMVLALREAGYRPIVFDNLSRGHRDAVREAPLVEGDLRDPLAIECCLRKNPVDLVMHFAALAYVEESVANPQLYYENNVVGSINLLAAMRKEGPGRVVFSSTCATYGEPQYVPIDEKHPQQPINPYGFGKLMAERALADYAKAYGFQSISLRYFNASGADRMGRVRERHDPETHLIPLVLEEAMRLERGGDPSQTKLKIYGTDLPTRDGSCIRDFVHVEDLCQAHLLAGARLLDDAVRDPEAYNLANGVGFSVLEVIETCRRVTGQKIEFLSMPRRSGDPSALVGDASRARRTLGWTPQMESLEAIIASAWRTRHLTP